MSGPRTKRQFAGAASDPAQRQITSFFSSKVANDTTSAAFPSAQSNTNLSSPQLPDHVQANLLSVGMRVRKSVPEGYKTGIYSGGFSLWTEGESTDSCASRSDNDRPVSVMPAANSPGELLPFCGIHKVGGYDTQSEYQPSSIFPSSDSHHHPTTVFPPAKSDFNRAAINDMSSQPSSQASTASSSSTSSARAPTTFLSAAAPASTNRKRFFAPDDTADAAVDVPAVYGSDWLDGEVSPRSLAPAGWENARVMAVPRRSRSWRQRAGIAGLLLGGGERCGGDAAAVGQENIDVQMALGDFEDAEFLDFRIAGGRGADMEMGGVEE